MRKLGIFVVLAIGLAFNLHAATIIVTSTADSGPGTLRSAIADASGGDTITFDPSLAGQTITLASTLTNNTSLTIDASALPGGVQISGNNAVEVFNVASGVTDVLNSLTITNGMSRIAGAGIYNNGTVTLNECTLLGNICTTNNGNSTVDYGGGICNHGTMTLNECTLSGNMCKENSEPSELVEGGGIYNDGTVTLNGCALSGNECQAINAGVQNTASGGGIFNATGGTITLNDCTLSGNSSAAEASDGLVSVSGGGIANSGKATLNECTLSGNTCGDLIFGPGTYAGAGGGGISSAGTLVLTNTIVAGNTQAFGGQASAIDVSGGYSGVSNIVGGSANLAALGNYGGPTLTMPPLPGSPAIGTGSVAANTFTSDQRGYSRTQNGLIDIGAVELPTVQFTAGPTNDWQLSPVKFNAPTVDSDGSAIVGWNWSFGDGNISSLQNPSDVYNMTGVFSPGLIVNNSLGLELAATGPAITVYPPLALGGISVSSGNLQLSGTNGISGLTYTVLTSTNLALPLSQWTPLSTNTWSANGAFSLTLTNVLNPLAAGRFYRLQVQ